MPTFDSHDGTRLHYEDYGAGRPIVFLASWALNAEMWEYQVPFFVDTGFRCVLLDRRGHGRSDRPSGGYGIDSRADDVAAMIEHLDLADIALVGHSIGGAEAAHYLARHGSARVSRVAFIASFLPFLKQTLDNPGGLPEEVLQATVSQWRADRPKWFADRVQGFFATHLDNDVSPALIDLTMRQCLSAAPLATTEVFRTSFHADHRESLRAIDIPALVVHGAADQSVPVEITGRRTAELLPHAAYVEYPTAGHGLHVTHRDQLNNDLLTFLLDKVPAA